METVGVYLKKERESKNISLREVARLTKISEFYLDYIEKDDYDKLPQGPYIKGYISSYSRLIGGDVDEALKLYDSLHTVNNQAEEIQPDIQQHKEWTAWIRASLNAIISLFEKVNHRSRSNPLKKTAATLLSASKTAARGVASYISSFFQKTFSLVAANAWLTRRQTWFYAFVALLGIGILVLAGVGFYHLFIYEANRPVAEANRPVAETSRPVAAPSQVPPAKKPSLLPGPVPAADQTRPPALPADPDIAKSRESSGADSPDSLALPAQSGHQASTPPEPSSLPVPTVLPQSTAERQANLPSNQNQKAPKLAQVPTAAAINLSVLKASICSTIVDRMPAGVASAFPSTVQRVYVWSQIEAKQVPSEIRHIYYFKGRKINDVTLSIRSPFWRTWSYKSISNDRYRGDWQVDIATTGGKVLRRLYFEIK